MGDRGDLMIFVAALGAILLGSLLLASGGNTKSSGKQAEARAAIAGPLMSAAGRAPDGSLRLLRLPMERRTMPR